MKSQSKSKAKSSEAQVLSLRPESEGLTTHVVDFANLPDLSKAKPKPINLDVEYWSPEVEGEYKTLIFSHIKEGEMIPDYNDSSNLIAKDTAYFLEQSPEGFQILRCAATRLVSTARNMIPGGIYLITYQGQKKNATNSNSSRRFSIQPVELEKVA